mmetsp:Transcript_45127/g.104341  ORF Transcript_45127/g.104341 Transcript_45127/m.104341 type:complete len:252 (-) Transcript_45127:122-877(-)
MKQGAGAIAWGTGSRRLRGSRPTSKASSSSNTTARIAGRSGRSNTSTRMVPSFRRFLAWYAAIATPRSSWSHSKLWTMSARVARSGRRHGCQRSQSHSTSTTSLWSVATAASVARRPSVGSWTSLAGSAGRTRQSSSTFGRKMAMRSGASAVVARSTSGPLRAHPNGRGTSRQTWSTRVKTASASGPFMPRNCFAPRALCVATFAAGSATPKCSRAGKATSPRPPQTGQGKRPRPATRAGGTAVSSWSPPA